MDIKERLKKISLFKAIKNEEESLLKIKDIIVEKQYPQDSFIIKEGEIGDCMYILNKGKISIEKKTLMGDTFSLAKLSEEQNFYFGEQALLDNDSRSASVRAITDTKCFMIKKDDFNKFCEENPYIGYLIIKDIAISLAAKLRKTTDDNLTLINALCCSDE